MEVPEQRRRFRHQCCWTYGCAVTVACLTTVLVSTFLLWPTIYNWMKGSPESDPVVVIKRYAHHHVHHWSRKDPKDIQDTNLWYSYAKMLANLKNQSNCYVCSVIPKSSLQPDLYGRPMSYEDGICFAILTAHGYNPGLIPRQVYNGNLKDNSNFHNCDDSAFPKLSVTIQDIPKPQAVIVPANVRFSLCFQSNDGTSPMGRVQTSQCEEVQSPPDLTPSKMVKWGTDFADGGWWLCGTKAYPTLPKGWTGICTPVFITDHTILISAQQIQEIHIRNRRALVVPTFAPHDALWGSDVPKEHKHWTTGQKVTLALFPWTGVAKNILRIETIDYRFKTFVNLSIDINEGQNKQLDAIRLMVLQNRMVLDMLTASQGGVCVMINTTCCTFIPDEVHGHVEQAMTALRNLRDGMARDGVSQSWDLLSWLFGGPWWQGLLRLFIPLIVVFTLFCMLMICVIPCLKSMVNKAISTAFVAQMMLAHRYEPVLADAAADDNV